MELADPSNMPAGVFADVHLSPLAGPKVWEQHVDVQGSLMVWEKDLVWQNHLGRCDIEYPYRSDRALLSTHLSHIRMG